MTGNGSNHTVNLFRVDGQFHNNQSSPPGLPEVWEHRYPLEKVGEWRSPQFKHWLSTKQPLQLSWCLQHSKTRL